MGKTSQKLYRKICVTHTYHVDDDFYNTDLYVTTDMYNTPNQNFKSVVIGKDMHYGDWFSCLFLIEVI